MNLVKIVQHLKDNLSVYIMCVLNILVMIFVCNLDIKRFKTDIDEVNYIIKSESHISKELQVDSIDTSSSRLMIVAHPDDETFWVSRQLYYENY